MARLYLVFRSTHETLKAEAVLQAAGLPCKVVRKPASVRLDCSLSVRVDAATGPLALSALRQSGIVPRGTYPI